MLVLDMMFFCMNLFMFLEILWSLERFVADLAEMGFKRSVDSKVTCDVISLGTAGVTIFPFAGQAKIVGALATDVVVA
jgi:hypothetical protein